MMGKIMRNLLYILLFLFISLPSYGRQYTEREVRMTQPDSDYFIDSSGKPVTGVVVITRGGMTVFSMLVDNGFASYMTIYGEDNLADILPYDRNTYRQYAENRSATTPPEPLIRQRGAINKYKYRDGSSYEGEMKDGLPHGVGTRRWLDGKVYNGEFEQGEPLGAGEITWDGNYYKGYVLYGEIMGQGSIKYKNGTGYAGPFFNGRPITSAQVYTKGSREKLMDTEQFQDYKGAEWGSYCPIPSQVTPGEVPLQGRVPAGIKPVYKNGYLLIPIAGYSINGRVLLRDDYPPERDNLAKYIEMDLGIGWKSAADPAKLGGITFTNTGRSLWTHLTPEGRRNYNNFMLRHSYSNTHVIAGSKALLSQLQKIKNGDIVTLSGWLVVSVRERDKYANFSSVSRTDSNEGSIDGAGACEIMLVCSVKWP